MRNSRTAPYIKALAVKINRPARTTITNSSIFPFPILRDVAGLHLPIAGVTYDDLIACSPPFVVKISSFSPVESVEAALAATCQATPCSGQDLLCYCRFQRWQRVLQFLPLLHINQTIMLPFTFNFSR